MKYRSTEKQAPLASLRDAVMRGLAPDGGLYMPEEIPCHSTETLEEFRRLPFTEVCFRVVQPFVGAEVPDQESRRIVSEAINFPVTLVSLSPELNLLELFHGPTLAFKDFGARFMARLMGYFVRGETRELTVLVATSGDTGSAVAHGFLRVPGIRVVILYPSKRVTAAQESQFTTLGENISALEVAGTFDDCQRLVKEAFSDAALNSQMLLTSANSINIARLLPQMFYYFSAWLQLPIHAHDFIVSVPSGNFGNLTAGLLAKRAGLPITRFIASTNVNDSVPEYLRTGIFRARPAIATYSNAMDVGNPSNFARVMDLCENRLEVAQREIWPYSATNEETLQGMKSLHDRFGYTADPHTAVGVLGWQAYERQMGDGKQGVALSTAHPAKFAEVVKLAIGESPTLPESLVERLKLQAHSVSISNRYESLREVLRSP
ncbi:MAG TPA: threonine synthase [Candidatus Acidoferrum sp.]|jgi:threonine synthase